MDTRQALAPLDEPAPDAWRAAALVAAGLTFLAVAASRGLASSVVDVLARTGLVGSLAPFYALAPVLGLALAVVPAAVVVLALRRPWAALTVAVVPVLLLLPLGLGVPAGLLVLLGGVCVAGSWRRPVVGVVATIAALAALGLGVLGLTLVGSGPVGAFEQLISAGRSITAAFWAVGLCGLLALTLVARDQLLASRRRQQVLAVRSAEVEEQSEVTAERARLARDLHDVVAHHVSLIAVRAETAPYTHPGLGAEARTVLAEIAADARRALDELRGVLGILGRSVGEDRLPQPSWGDIAALVERSSSSGQPVDLAGDVRAEVDPAVGYVAYRVVQEGLTNARKHAPGAPVSVRLERTAHLAVVSVASSGASSGGSSGGSTGRSPGAVGADLDATAPITGLRGPSRGAHPGDEPATAPLRAAGHGLVGMRERVEALGGRLVAGRRDGGFVVEATLPLAAGDRR